MSRRARIRSERVSLRAFEGGREEVEMEESRWRICMLDSCGVEWIDLKKMGKGGCESTSVGEIGRVVVVVEDGAWLRSIEVGVFDFFEFDHFDDPFSLSE